MMLAAITPRPRLKGRHPVYLEARLESGLSVGSGRVLNISEGGLFVTTEMALTVGSRVTVTEREEGVRHLHATGIVVHRVPHQGLQGLGVRFLSPVVAPAVRAILDDLGASEAATA